MDQSQILEIVSKSLNTEKGKKLLGAPLDIKSITSRLSELGNKFGVDVSTIISADKESLKEAITRATDPDGKRLTREQRRQNRANKRKSRRERIEQRLEEAGVDPSQDIGKISAEIQILKSKLKSQTPTFETFKISGRLFDKTNGKPLQGVNISVGVSTSILGEEKVEPTLSIGNQDLISPEININPNDFIYVPTPFLLESRDNITDKKGNFTIKVKVPVIPANQKTPLDIALLFSKSGFLPSTSTILNGDRTIKTTLSASSITNIEEAAKNLSQEYRDKIDQAQSKVSSLALDLFDKVISVRKDSISKVVDTIKTKLLPLAVSLLLAFGIAKITQMNRKTCPTPTALDNVFRTRNRVVRQLNQLFRTITINTALAAAFFALAKTLKGVRLSLDALPAPQAIGTFPAKDFGGLIFAQPYSFTAKLQAISAKLKELEEQNESLNRAILTSLIFLIAGCATVVILLKSIDKLIQECAEEAGGSQLQLVAINQELLDLAAEEEEDGNPVIPTLNGFIFSVETDNKNPVGTLKRRFAVAKNNQGVTLLKGEPSFSSSDQILIDELIFYIQQNDLKAF
jgi:hypothetical protein